MKLADWLRINLITRSDFARRIGVTPQSITGYCDGSFGPSREKSALIANETHGQVTANDFVPAIPSATEAAE